MMNINLLLPPSPPLFYRDDSTIPSPKPYDFLNSPLFDNSPLPENLCLPPYPFPDRSISEGNNNPILPISNQIDHSVSAPPTTSSFHSYVNEQSIVIDLLDKWPCGHKRRPQYGNVMMSKNTRCPHGCQVEELQQGVRACSLAKDWDNTLFCLYSITCFQETPTIVEKAGPGLETIGKAFRNYFCNHLLKFICPVSLGADQVYKLLEEWKEAPIEEGTWIKRYNLANSIVQWMKSCNYTSIPYNASFLFDPRVKTAIPSSYQFVEQEKYNQLIQSTYQQVDVNITVGGKKFEFPVNGYLMTLPNYLIKDFQQFRYLTSKGDIKSAIPALKLIHQLEQQKLCSLIVRNHTGTTRTDDFYQCIVLMYIREYWGLAVKEYINNDNNNNNDEANKVYFSRFTDGFKQPDENDWRKQAAHNKSSTGIVWGGILESDRGIREKSKRENYTKLYAHRNSELVVNAFNSILSMSENELNYFHAKYKQSVDDYLMNKANCSSLKEAIEKIAITVKEVTLELLTDTATQDEKAKGISYKFKKGFFIDSLIWEYYYAVVEKFEQDYKQITKGLYFNQIKLLYQRYCEYNDCKLTNNEKTENKTYPIVDNQRNKYTTVIQAALLIQYLSYLRQNNNLIVENVNRYNNTLCFQQLFENDSSNILMDLQHYTQHCPYKIDAIRANIDKYNKGLIPFTEYLFSEEAEKYILAKENFFKEYKVRKPIQHFTRSCCVCQSTTNPLIPLFRFSLYCSACYEKLLLSNNHIDEEKDLIIIDSDSEDEINYNNINQNESMVEQTEEELRLELNTEMEMEIKEEQERKREREREEYRSFSPFDNNNNYSWTEEDLDFRKRFGMDK